MAEGVSGRRIHQQGKLEGTCTSFLSCFFDSSSAKNHQTTVTTETTSARCKLPIEETCHDEELLDDLELVLEGRGLISTIFLPSKVTSQTSSSSVPRTAFIRCKKGEAKVECQVVVDNSIVSNGTLKRFKFSALDVTRVTTGRDRNSLIPAVVDDSLIMRFTISKKGELHFVFESQHVRDDIVQGFRLLIAKKKATLTEVPPSKIDDVRAHYKSELKNNEQQNLPERDISLPMVKSPIPRESTLEGESTDSEKSDDKAIPHQITQ